MTVEEIRAAIAECERTRSKLFIETANLDARIAAEGDSPGLDERRENMNRGVAKLDAEIADLTAKAEDGEAKRARVLELGDRGEPGDGGVPLPGSEPRSPRRDANPTRDAALRMIEEHRDSFAPKSGDTIDRLVRRGDPTGIAGRYIAAVGDDSYASAFGKMLSDPQSGHLRFTPQEVESVRLVSAVQAERALLEGTPGGGGFALPLDLDPTVLLASDGAINPLRSLATVQTTAAYEWHGVSSVGVVAAYAAEGVEVTDGAPALLGPIIVPEMARCFIPFSIEIGMDWVGAGLQAEMARLFADAKDVLEATAFLTGAGHASQEPEGLLTGLIAATPTLVIPTATADVLAYTDVYGLVEAVPPRWQPSTTVLGAPAVFDFIHQMIGGGSTTNLPILPLREGPVCGRAKAELFDDGCRHDGRRRVRPHRGQHRRGVPHRRQDRDGR